MADEAREAPQAVARFLDCNRHALDKLAPGSAWHRRPWC